MKIKKNGWEMSVKFKDGNGGDEDYGETVTGMLDMFAELYEKATFVNQLTVLVQGYKGDVQGCYVIKPEIKDDF